MSMTAKIGSGAAAFLILALGGTLWAEQGAAVYFDMLAASFVGCFF